MPGTAQRPACGAGDPKPQVPPASRLGATGIDFANDGPSAGVSNEVCQESHDEALCVPRATRKSKIMPHW
jgi:hypothetical protein